MAIQQSGNSSLKPLAESERMHVLDALRGFAILGIFVVNLYYLSGYRYFPAESFSTASTDETVLFYVNLLALGKFYTLFSFLFGLGFAIQMNRTSKKRLPFLPLYFKRLGILFLIGLVHTFVWQGDILTVYAIAALLLIPFRKASNKAILISALLLLISPVLLEYIMLSTKIIPGKELYLLGQKIKDAWQIPSSSLIVKEGNFTTYVLSKVPASLHRYSELFSGSRFPKLWGMFLLGLYFGKNKIFSDLNKNIRLFKNIFIIGGIVGIAFSLAFSLLPWPFTERIYNEVYRTFVRSLGEHPLGMAYMAGFTLLYMKKKVLLDWMTYVGRMALTNYLMQSIVGIVIFYNLGLGLGPVGPVFYVPFAFLFYLIQVLYSRWWLKHFKYGPVEYLWRSGIYGKLQTFRKVPAEVRN